MHYKNNPIMRKVTGAALGVATLVSGVILPLSAAATTPDPIIHYSFDQALNGATITNEGTASNSDATLSGTATVENGQISLTGSQYITIPTTAISDNSDITMSIWLKNNFGNGNTAAAYIGNASQNKGYYLLNPANPKGYVKSVVTSATVSAPNSSPWTTETGPGGTNAATSGKEASGDLSLYTVSIAGTPQGSNTYGTVRSYLDGEPLSSTSAQIPSGGLKNYADLVAFIGKSAYDDPYTKIDVDDYAIYDTALDDAAVKDLYTTQVSGKVFKDISVQHCATDDFKIPTTTIGIPVTWASDNDAISIDSTGTATVKRPAAGEQDATVTLSATVSINGKTITKRFSVNVPHTLSGDEKLKADADAITIDNADDIRTNFSVPTQGANGSAISWTVSDPGTAQATISDGVNATSQTVSVTRPSAGNEAATVILQAKLTLEGHTSTRDFVVTVQPLPSSSEEDEAYIWAFFTGEGVGGEKISLAASKGNNALDWNTLNDGTPLFTSTQGEQGLRDPFIFKSKDGDKFYMIATDLKISGRAGSFTSAQMNGSKYIEIWESDDLVNWSNERHVKVSSDYAGNTWAPEAYYDSQIGKYVVYWASNLYDGTDATTRTKPSYNRMVYVTTEDFVNFSDPTIWIDVDRRGQDGAGSIDATVQQDGDTYYRVYKDENSMTLRQEQSTNLLATVNGSYPTSSAVSDQWSLVKEKIGNGTTGYNGTFAGQGEGPSLFKANAGDVNGYDWYLFIDQPNYHHNQEGNAGPNHYVPFGTNDIANADWTGLAESMPESNFPKNSDGGMPRHGTVLPVTRAQYQKVLEAYAKNIAVSDVQSVSVKTKVGQDPTDLLPSSLTLTKADASQAQANVTWDAIDAQSYAQVGTFTVNGIADDDSAMPVTATVSVTSDEEPSPTEPDVTLKSLTIAGQNVDMKDLMDGSAQLTLEDPSKVGVDDVVAVAHDPEAQVVVDVDGGVVSVTVTSPDGSKNAVYTVKLVKRSAQTPQPGTDQPTTPSNPNTPGAGDGSGKHDLATTGTASAWIVVLSALLALFGIFMLIESRKLHSRV